MTKILNMNNLFMNGNNVILNFNLKNKKIGIKFEI